MSTARALIRTLALGSALTMALVAAVAACSAKSNPVGPGGECFLAADCAPGLVCVEQPNKTRQCSDDLERVAGRPPEEGGVMDDGAAGEGGPDAPSDRVTPADTGPRDTGSPPADTGPG